MLAYTAKSTGAFPKNSKGKESHTAIKEKNQAIHQRSLMQKKNSTEIKRHQRIPVEALDTFYYRSKMKVHNENG